MARAKRQKTKYPGVYYRKVTRTGTTKMEKSYFVRFKCPVDSNYYEVAVGVEHRDKMTPATANKVRVKYIDGELLPDKVRRDNIKTVQALWDRYMKSVDKRGKRRDQRGSTFTYWRYFNRFIFEYFGEDDMTELTEEMVKEFRGWLHTQTAERSGNPLSNATVKQTLSILRAIYKYGGLRTVYDWSIPTVDNVRSDDLTAEQFKGMIERLNNDLHFEGQNMGIKTERRMVAAHAVLFVMFTGCRRSEALRLTWDNIDIDKKEIIFKGPKGGSDVTIPMNDYVSDLMIGLRSKARLTLLNKTNLQGRSVAPAILSNKVFICSDYSVPDITKYSRRHMNALNIPAHKVRPLHGLRYYYASELINKGVDLKSVSALLGHHSLSTTEIYVASRMTAKRAATDLFSSEYT